MIEARYTDELQNQHQNYQTKLDSEQENMHVKEQEYNDLIQDVNVSVLKICFISLHVVKLNLQSSW